MVTPKVHNPPRFLLHWEPMGNMAGHVSLGSEVRARIQEYVANFSL